jgi:hypothetical protein
VVTVEVGDLALKSMQDQIGSNPAKLSRAFSWAIQHYLADRDSGRIGLQRPDFLVEAEPRSRHPVSIEVDGALWDEFRVEAERQELTADQLVEHAVLYLAADLDSGRLTERILEDLDD